jgi:hypothetical protein
MFTSRGNIRRERKAPRLPPNSTSDRMVMKRLRDERIRQAGADGQNLESDNHDHARNENGVDHWEDNNQNPPADNYDVHQNHWHDDGEKSANFKLDNADNGDDDDDDDDDDSDDSDDNDDDDDDNDN